MRAGTTSPSEFRRRGLAAVSLLLLAASLTGCYQNPDPRDYGAPAKKNFVAGCTTAVAADNGTTTTTLIASKATCECIYELIKSPESGVKGRYPIKWDDLKAYEDKQSKAKEGDLPTPPKHLTDAIDACQEQGPVAEG